MLAQLTFVSNIKFCDIKVKGTTVNDKISDIKVKGTTVNDKISCYRKTLTF